MAYGYKQAFANFLMEIKYNINEEKGTLVAYFDGGKQNVKEHMEYQMLKLTYNTYPQYIDID